MSWQGRGLQVLTDSAIVLILSRPFCSSELHTPVVPPCQSSLALDVSYCYSKIKHCHLWYKDKLWVFQAYKFRYCDWLLRCSGAMKFYAALETDLRPVSVSDKKHSPQDEVCMTANDCMWVSLANLTPPRNNSILVHTATQLFLLLPSEILGFQAEVQQAINLCSRVQQLVLLPQPLQPTDSPAWRPSRMTWLVWSSSLPIPCTSKFLPVGIIMSQCNGLAAEKCI